MNDLFKTMVVARHKGPFNSKGTTSHFVRGVLTPVPDELVIVKFGEDEFNVIHMQYGVEITDTGHATIEEAIEQVGFEFEYDEKRWEFSQ